MSFALSSFSKQRLSAHCARSPLFPAAPSFYTCRTGTSQASRRAFHLATPSTGFVRGKPGLHRFSSCERRTFHRLCSFKSRASLDQDHKPLKSRLDLLSVSVAVLLVCLGVGLQSHWSAQTDKQLQGSSETTLRELVMAPEALPGRPGNLTPEQEEKLRQLWGHVLKLCGVADESVNPMTEAVAAGETDATAGEGKSEAPESAKSGKDKEKTKKRMSIFRKNKDKDHSKESKTDAQSSPGIKTHIKEGDGDDKYGQTQQFFDALANQSPESLRATIWSMVKHDHPDALLLRFLRARKWDVDKALVMMISTMNWRLTEMHVDDDIMKNGEAQALADEKGGEGDAKTLGADFMAQIRMGKSFLHGVDKSGRPICVVRVRLHRQGEQCEQSLERYTVYIIETARMLLAPPVDTATIVFDMTDFSMANMDYTPVKFMIKCFEANYPESLGAVLVHKAPWLFQGIWKVIKGWLDPVVAGKVHFTNNVKDMEEFIEPNHIIKELDGGESFEYKYVEPVPGENDTMKDTETRDKMLEHREELVHEWEGATLRWIITSGTEEGKVVKAERDELAQKLKEDYWKLDPYLRARSYYDRTGVIQSGGKINFYPSADEAAAANGASKNDTSADDVD